MRSGFIAFLLFMGMFIAVNTFAQDDRSSIVIYNGATLGCAVVSIENHTFLTNSKDNTIHLNLENDVDVGCLWVEILFDTTCFDVKTVKGTERSEHMGIFVYDYVKDGIRIVICGLGTAIGPGMGSIVEFCVDVGDCHEGYYLWDITYAEVHDASAIDILEQIIDGNIAVISSPKGDINSDDIANALDVILAVRIATGLNPNPSEREFQAGDCNLDGKVDVTDILGIVNVIIGIGNCPP